MKILVVVATTFECRLNIDENLTIGDPKKVLDSMAHQVDLLVTGVGAVPTSFALTRYAIKYDLVINIGIAGSYSSKYQIGDVVCVKEDAFGDYGIDNQGIFQSLSDINFKGNTLYLAKRYFENPWQEKMGKTLSFPQVKGLTLSTASGSQDIIDKIIKFWGADIETMEGAAVFYVCNQLKIPFVCLRAISNMVEPRDKSKWETGIAIENLDKSLRQFIQNLS